MTLKPQDFKHVNYLWEDSIANHLDPVERLRYRSNILGADQRITNTGGGNTSSKVTRIDPFAGRSTLLLDATTTHPLQPYGLRTFRN